MRTLDTAYGQVLVNLDLTKGSSWGYYSLIITLEFEGNKDVFRFHKTDATAFDKYEEIEDDEERFDFLYESYKYQIEECINDFCNELRD